MLLTIALQEVHEILCEDRVPVCRLGMNTSPEEIRRDEILALICYVRQQERIAGDGPVIPGESGRSDGETAQNRKHDASGESARMLPGRNERSDQYAGGRQGNEEALEGPTERQDHEASTEGDGASGASPG